MDPPFFPFFRSRFAFSWSFTHQILKWANIFKGHLSPWPWHFVGPHQILRAIGLWAHIISTPDITCGNDLPWGWLTWIGMIEDTHRMSCQHSNIPEVGKHFGYCQLWWRKHGALVTTAWLKGKDTKTKRFSKFTFRSLLTTSVILSW